MDFIKLDPLISSHHDKQDTPTSAIETGKTFSIYEDKKQVPGTECYLMATPQVKSSSTVEDDEGYANGYPTSKEHPTNLPDVRQTEDAQEDRPPNTSSSELLALPDHDFGNLGLILCHDTFQLTPNVLQ